MAEVTSRFQPSFSLFPINNNRTGYQPVNLPVVLVVPYRRTASGQTVGDTNVFNVRYFIEEAPGRARVSGFQNKGIFVPSLERFSIPIDSRQLADVRHDPTGDFFFDQSTNEPIDFELARIGDLFQFGLMRGPLGSFGTSGPGVIDSLPYYPDADYHDLSPFIIETFDLPQGRYRFVWAADYYERITSASGEVICVDTSKVSTARFVIDINHPGEIHQTMRNWTPELYFSGSRVDQDPTINFYRPFADALQDIFDEQELLRGVNWIDKIPVQYIPYLAFLIGMDMPYFPSSTDNVRRALLRNGRRLQQLKGSKRAIRELFEIFGFTIDLTNLWYSKDGSRFIAPDEQLPSDIADQKITTEDVCHSEPLLNAFNNTGFGQIEVPLLFRPIGNLTVDAFLVEKGSPAAQALQELSDSTAQDVEAVSSNACSLTADGFQANTAFGSIPGPIIGMSRVLLDPKTGTIAEEQSGVEPVINGQSVTYDFDRNSFTVNFDHYLNFEEEFSNRVVYVFATYERKKIILPPALADLRSNRFDINVLTFKDGTIPSSDIFEFLIDFLFKFKAFHSLLRKIAFTLEIDEVYNVQDFCLGGEFGEAPGSDLGNIQVPPAIIPVDLTAGVCQNVPVLRGFKDSDLLLRDRIRKGLEEEHSIWKNLDGSHDVPADQLPILQSLSRIQIKQGDGSDCEFTQLGQDRILDSGIRDYDHTIDDRPKLCDLENNTSDYCYKGRVQDELDPELVMQLSEIFRCKPCSLTPGVGSYYLTRLVPMNELSGGETGTNAADLTNIQNLRRSFHDSGYVRIMGFPNAEIHYTDQSLLGNLEETINNRFFATRKPSLDLQKDNMFIPGHRFISMANQPVDFYHPEYNFRPWDDIFQQCPKNKSTDNINFGVGDFGVGGYGGESVIPNLNARIIQGTDGNDILLFDPVQLVYYANGLPADIPRMDDHTSSPHEPDTITHSMWSSFDPGLCWSRGNQYGVRYECAIDQVNPGDDIVLRYPLEAIGEMKDTICFSDSMNPIFKSANRDCECPDDPGTWIGESLENYIERDSNLTDGFFGPTDVSGQPGLTQGADFIDGYPASYGLFNTDLNDYDFPRETIEGYGFSRYGVSQYGARGGEVDLNHSMAIGIPMLGIDGRYVELNFRIGSGIRLAESDPQYKFYEPMRLDCGCAMYDCPVDEGTGVTDATAVGVGGGDPDPRNNGVRTFGRGRFGGGQILVPTNPMIVKINRCPEDLFVQPNGSFDYNCDQISMNRSMLLDEYYGAKSCLMDGSIPNMLSFDETKFSMNGPIDNLPPQGVFQYIDDYGIQYIGMFETFQNRIDITIVTKDPRVPGSDGSTGEVINRKVFRDGIISMERQIIQTMDSGFMIIAEGYQSEQSRFQTSFGCGDETFEDPFQYHLDFQISDEVAFIINPVVTTLSDVENEFGVELFGLDDFGA